jgi:ferric-dicitrate binding protein FerR (iron transport regulator)
MRSIRTDDALQKVRKQLFAVRPWQLAAAAIVMLALALPLLHPNNRVTRLTNVQAAPKEDLWPAAGSTRIQLDDEHSLLLDTLRGLLPATNGMPVALIAGGHIAYHQSNASSAAFSGRHVLSTGAGAQYKLLLPDGSRVWLNALSTLSYTSALVNGCRSVTLKGEAYFEIAKDARHPFIVSANNVVIRVKGTGFNVRAYANEQAVDILLTHGAVTINDAHALHPGEEALALADGKLRITKGDTVAALAWKEGVFNFKNAALEDIMQEIARWYNASIVYKEKTERHFTAEIPRQLPVSTLLHLLEATGDVHFSISGKTITVSR